MLTSSNTQTAAPAPGTIVQKIVRAEDIAQSLAYLQDLTGVAWQFKPQMGGAAGQEMSCFVVGDPDTLEGMLDIETFDRVCENINRAGITPQAMLHRTHDPECKISCGVMLPADQVIAKATGSRPANQHLNAYVICASGEHTR